MSKESQFSQSWDSYGLTKLNGKNYLGWAYNVEQVLEEHEVWNIVNGQETSPTIENEPAESSKGKVATPTTDPTWSDRKATAMHIISFTIEDRQQQPIRSTEDPKEAWDILERLHASKSFQRKLNLIRKLHGLRKSATTTLTDHENSFHDTLEELSAIGKVFDLENLIIMYLLSLPEEYQNVEIMLGISGVDGMTLESVMAKVQNEEERMGRMAGSLSRAAAANQALFIGGKSSRGKSGKSGNSGKSNQNRSSKFRKGVNCHYCDKEGHIQTECRKKIADD
jgi:gag-polypeptide of LTR copia-type